MKHYLFNATILLLSICVAPFIWVAGFTMMPNEPATDWEPVVDYVQNAVVVALEGSEADLVVCETEDGNLWEFYSDEWAVGDTVVLFMLNNDTPETIYDDVIYDVI